MTVLQRSKPLSATSRHWVVEDIPAGTFRVNRAALTDEAIFRDEKRSIFDRCWLYVGHAAHTFGYQLFGCVAEGIPQSARTDGQVHHLVTVRAPDGRWINNIPRPPMLSNDVNATALATHAIKHYGWLAREEEFAASIEHARR
jgi:hypothetical protein